MQLEQKAWKGDIHNTLRLWAICCFSLYKSLTAKEVFAIKWKLFILCVCAIEDQDSSETVELSGELPGRTSRSLMERFMSVGLLAKLSGSKSRSTKVWHVIYFTIVCWLFAIVVLPLHSFNHRRIQELHLGPSRVSELCPLPRNFFYISMLKWRILGVFWL